MNAVPAAQKQMGAVAARKGMQPAAPQNSFAVPCLTPVQIVAGAELQIQHEGFEG